MQPDRTCGTPEFSSNRFIQTDDEFGQHHPVVLIISRQTHTNTTPEYYLFVFGTTAPPQWARAPSFTRFLYHTQRRTTIGKTPLDKWSARRRDLYLTTLNTHNRDIHASGGFRTHNLSKRVAADVHFRRRGHCDRPRTLYVLLLLIAYDMFRPFHATIIDLFYSIFSIYVLVSYTWLWSNGTAETCRRKIIINLCIIFGCSAFVCVCVCVCMFVD